jgi:DNA topoisomerase II
MSKSKTKAKINNDDYAGNTGLTIEETYQKKTLHEFILDIPDTYVGSIEHVTCKMWIFDESLRKIVRREITYVPAFYKIYDEAIVNAGDHTKRTNTCKTIKVDIDIETGRITIWNDGSGVDVAMHKVYNVMIPTMIFGQLLASTNYEKEKERIVGGKNGVGIKLANIYSSIFELETVDAVRKKKFYQKFYNNMYDADEPIVTNCSSRPYTKISFIPDYERFGMTGMTDSIFSLFKKRVIDLAMTSGVTVYFNDEIIKTNNFSSYVDLYFDEDEAYTKIIDCSNERWKICVVYDKTDKLDHEQISFVNNIHTIKGGTHVKYVIDQIVAELKTAVGKKLKGVNIKQTQITENIIIFVDSIIVNPTFDSQTKETLKTEKSKFGSAYNISPAFVKKLMASGIVQNIIDNAAARIDKQLEKVAGTKKGLPVIKKCYHASEAGLKRKIFCTMIFTEGDSAKTLVMTGFNIIGRDTYGVYPLKGKISNTRDAATSSDISESETIINIMKIIGLVPNKIYHDTRELNYDCIMLLTDQDNDGHHIKGLIMNLIQSKWPQLLLIPGFIRSFATPLLKAFKSNGKHVIEFTNFTKFEEWKQKNNDGHGWKIKYYKGLGTLNKNEALECFKNLSDKIVKYYWRESADDVEINELNETEFYDIVDRKINTAIVKGTNNASTVDKYVDICYNYLTLAFKKDRADDRKLWIGMINRDDYIDPDKRYVAFDEFVNKELIFFSSHDCERSIPNVMDGLKPSQRKVIYTCFKNKYFGIDNEIKVSDLCGHVSSSASYHHGEASMQSTIVALAQNYVGSNNINLLIPSGGFGSRVVGGKDSASARYITTSLYNLTKYIFREEDFSVGEKQYDDGKEIEPVYYVPVIPMILINGSEGIGTGWSTFTSPHNPRDVYENCVRINSGKKIKEMIPWYRHFTGEIIKSNDAGTKFLITANYEFVDDQIIIKDLPIGVWTDKYKSFIEDLLVESVQAKNEIMTTFMTNEKQSNKKGAGTKSKATNTLAQKNKKVIGAKTKVTDVPAQKNKPKKKITNLFSYCIKKFDEKNTDVKIDMTITYDEVMFDKMLDKFSVNMSSDIDANTIKSMFVEKYLKLATTVATTNVNLFDPNVKIKKYSNHNDIFNDFMTVRLRTYEKRKEYLLEKWNNEANVLFYIVKFIDCVLESEIRIWEEPRKGKSIGKPVSKDAIIQRLEDLDFPKISTDQSKPSYNYITNIKLFDLTAEKVEELKNKLSNKQNDIEELENKTTNDMWADELEDFINEYDIWEKNANDEYIESFNAVTDNSKGKGKGKAKAAGKGKAKVAGKANKK